jgi:hypothetical protein
LEGCGQGLRARAIVKIGGRTARAKKKRRSDPALLKFQGETIGGALSRNFPGGDQSQHEKHQEDHQEDPEQEFCDREGRARDATKTQNGGDKAQNQKKYGETQHGVSSK